MSTQSLINDIFSAIECGLAAAKTVKSQAVRADDYEAAEWRVKHIERGQESLQKLSRELKDHTP